MYSSRPQKQNYELVNEHYGHFNANKVDFSKKVQKLAKIQIQRCGCGEKILCKILGWIFTDLVKVGRKYAEVFMRAGSKL